MKAAAGTFHKEVAGLLLPPSKNISNTYDLLAGVQENTPDCFFIKNQEIFPGIFTGKSHV